nr:hypothetical protein [Tanacetum cinerariifolium]
MEEYIRLEKEKAQKRRKVFNWETAKYGKISYDEDVHDLRSVETEFPAIVFNDNLTSNEMLFCEPTEMVEDGFGAYWLRSERVISNKGDLSEYWVEISFRRDFWRGAPSYTYIRDLVRRLCHSMDRGAANVPYQLAHYLFKHVEGRKSGAILSGEHFIGRLAHHFGLVSDDGLRGLSVVTREIPLINMGELVKLNIFKEIEDDWAWIAPDVGSLCGLMERSITDWGRVSTWMIRCMTRLMEASGQTYQAFDGTFRGSTLAVFERRTRQRTGEASTSTALHQPDPCSPIPYLLILSSVHLCYSYHDVPKLKTAYLLTYIYYVLSIRRSHAYATAYSTD